MPRHRREVAEKLAAQLFETETAVETALTRASAFLGAIPAARVDARLSATIGQEAFDHVVAAIAALNAARREMVEAHNALAEVQKRLGLAEVNFGAFIDKPDWPKKEARLRNLRVVERDAA
ncbi:hypothetical protein [Thermaurantiacus sp.]